MEDKIISREAFADLREGFRKRGKTVVLCHGVFDLLHYGHVEHLQEAKSLGDILVVSVTAARFVNKGPGRPYFNDKQRMAFLASLECVDYVLLSEAVTVHEVVKCVRPDIYVKGQEYAAAENDVTGNIGPEQEIVESFGGRIHFTNGEVHSSTKLLNNFFGALPEDVVETSQALRISSWMIMCSARCRGSHQRMPPCPRNMTTWSTMQAGPWQSPVIWRDLQERSHCFP